MATIIEVAKLADVSIATVSNVIRGTRRVSSKLTERVHAAIRELNYSPNEIARSLKVRQTRMLALVHARHHQSFLSRDYPGRGGYGIRSRVFSGDRQYG